MALVGYSDSEDSDSETTPTIKAAPVAPKRLERTEGNKIKIDLSSSRPESIQQPSEPAPKRQKTGGAFSGFNNLLPAPKRAAQGSLKPGINLKTSSEAAFSRVPPPRLESTTAASDEEAVTGLSKATTINNLDPPAQETKLVGKTTRFLPLSVSNAKKKQKSRLPAVPTPSEETAPSASSTIVSDSVGAAPKAKAKQSLFSMSAGDTEPLKASSTPYEPEFIRSNVPQQETSQTGAVPVPTIQQGQDNALDHVAADLNLSASERRRLFGRHGNQAEVKISHFDMDSEYRANQESAANGEAVEHRTVRTVAPGRHSLQQLINNVKGQTEAIEEKWAEGRRNRGEAGSKYGW